MRHFLRSLLLRGAARRHASRPAARASSTPNNILLIRPDHLGDVLFLTPALRALRRAQPDATITTLVGPWAEDLLSLNPDVNTVESLRFPWFTRSPNENLLAPYRALYAAAEPLAGRFDVAIISRFDHWWGAWLAAAAGIPRIIGYDVPDVRPFLTDVVPYRAGQHEVLQNLGLTHTLGTEMTATPESLPLRYEISGVHRMKIRQLLNGSGLQKVNGPLVAIHPGSGAAVKRWSVEQWGALMRAMRAQYGCQFVITGGSAEALLASKVVRAAGEEVPVVSLADDTDLPELAALFEQCALVIGPDSGPLHIAVTMGRPTVHLYGPVSPQTFGPWGSPHRHVVITQSLACQYCHRLDWREEELPDHPCISGMSLDMVMRGVERAWQNTEQSR